jgi:hypothetical protein
MLDSSSLKHEIISLKYKVPAGCTYFSLEGMADIIPLIDNILLNQINIFDKTHIFMVHQPYRKIRFSTKFSIEIDGIHLNKNEEYEIRLWYYRRYRLYYEILYLRKNKIYEREIIFFLSSDVINLFKKIKEVSVEFEELFPF